MLLTTSNFKYCERAVVDRNFLLDWTLVGWSVQIGPLRVGLNKGRITIRREDFCIIESKSHYKKERGKKKDEAEGFSTLDLL